MENRRIILQRDKSKIEVNTLGAELKSFIFNKEILWNHSKFWNKTSPVLFPFVGGLKDNVYEYDNIKYSIGRHGFARDKYFEVIAQDDDSITFILRYDKSTLDIYPFKFELIIKYTLNDNILNIDYSVKNVDNKTMIFTLGTHPAFVVDKNSYLEFEKIESSKIFTLENGLISGTTIFFDRLDNKRIIPLEDEYGFEDTLIFENIESKYVIIHNDENDIKVSFEGFKYLALWRMNNAPYICVEPWYGLPDNVNSNNILTDKDNMIYLESNDIFKCNLSIEVIN